MFEHYEHEIERLRTQLDMTIEEYQSANEKLRVSNEELMSMNEELQSTTEELETSKEELQSLNEELQTVNDELNDKIRTLDELNSDLRNLMRSTDIGTIFLDRDLTIKRFTDPVTDYFNLLPTDRGRPLDHITHSLQTDRLADDARRILEGEELVENDVEREDGQHLLVRILPYLTADGEVDGVVLTFIDIAARKRYEQRLIESRDRAEQLAELRSMFLSTLSHDVRSPLTAIITMAGVMRRRLDGDQVDTIDRIERAARQLHKILDSILRMAKLETHETVARTEAFDLVGVIDEVLSLHEPIAESEGLAIDYEGPSPPVDVELDPRFLTQILNNLVDNAIKYTDQGGVTVRLGTDDDRVTIAVADTGIGIPEEEREVIFERFETSSDHDDADYDSIGLGLAITRLLTESMEGEISVESAPDEGSTFAVTFPRILTGNTT